ncbi:MAG TPA: deoxyribose-phosphate aldolase [Anaerovoracaceae bacterium]|nr:deoxyribose-phosphate aldolase [Anaerovoracaceae bacterium]
MTDLTAKTIAKMIDHSLLQPQMTRTEIEEGCEIAKKYDTASVCVRGYDVAYCVRKLEGTNVLVCVVTGFPHGNSTTAAKVFESKDAIANGAGEVDVVIPIGLVRSGMYDYMKEELTAVHKACSKNNVPLKVIFENAYLSKEEIAQCAQVCDALDVAFVKTSTGYAPSGAVAEDVKIMRENVKDSIKIKAAGGVRTLDQLLELYELGVTRFGTRSTVDIMAEAIKRGL